MQYIGTIDRKRWTGRAVKTILGRIDTEWAIVGRETGANGYDHWQFAVSCSGDLESYNLNNNLGWHVEKCVSWEKSVRYCRKDGRYFLFGNSPASERLYKSYRDGRFHLNSTQSDILRSVRRGNDRTVTVWIDRNGSAGKSTLLYLEEIGGRWISVPRAEQSAVRIVDFIAQNYQGEKAICLDLPRDKTLTPALCGAIEDLKDGNVKSAKYQGTKLFIKGVKIVVFTNNWIPPKTFNALSRDRWDIHVIGGEHENENPTR